MFQDYKKCTYIVNNAPHHNKQNSDFIYQQYQKDRAIQSMAFANIY